MKVIVKSKKGDIDLELADNATVKDLQHAFHKKNSKFPPERQRFSLESSVEKGGKVVLKDSKKNLSDYGVTSGSVIAFKDLGPQFGYQATFLVEYFGPIFIHPAFYFGASLIHGASFEHSQIQKVALGMVLIHYIKRELETLFVHRFSHGTMPLFNLFKNSGHYWILGGVLVAFDLYSPWNLSKSLVTPKYVYLAGGVWVFAQLSNLYTHIYLSSLRKPNSTERKIPYGYGFDLVSCPNYLFEILGWVAFSVLTGSYASWFFTIVGAGQMAQWALDKHKSYKKDFPNYPKGRKALVPFIF